MMQHQEVLNVLNIDSFVDEISVKGKVVFKTLPDWIEDSLKRFIRQYAVSVIEDYVSTKFSFSEIECIVEEIPFKVELPYSDEEFTVFTFENILNEEDKKGFLSGAVADAYNQFKLPWGLLLSGRGDGRVDVILTIPTAQYSDYWNEGKFINLILALKQYEERK